MPRYNADLFSFDAAPPPGPPRGGGADSPSLRDQVYERKAAARRQRQQEVQPPQGFYQQQQQPRQRQRQEYNPPPQQPPFQHPPPQRALPQRAPPPQPYYPQPPQQYHQYREPAPPEWVPRPPPTQNYPPAPPPQMMNPRRQFQPVEPQPPPPPPPPQQNAMDHYGRQPMMRPGYDRQLVLPEIHFRRPEQLVEPPPAGRLNRQHPQSVAPDHMNPIHRRWGSPKGLRAARIEAAQRGLPPPGAQEQVARVERNRYGWGFEDKVALLSNSKMMPYHGGLPRIDLHSQKVAELQHHRARQQMGRAPWE